MKERLVAGVAEDIPAQDIAVMLAEMTAAAVQRLDAEHLALPACFRM